jgi:hypothetical protein
MRLLEPAFAMAVGLAAALAVAAPAAAPTRAASLSDYRGTGAWVDIYDARQLRQPEATVARLSAAGVRTLYLETANHRRSASVAIVHPAAVGRFLDAARAHGIRTIAWYLPGFRNVGVDLARSLAAIDFESPNGARFDGFALDMEATVVRSIARRNARLLELSRELRRAVGPRYALGAIVPDALSTSCRGCLWPGFPYHSVARLYDVFLPMAYSSARGRGARFVRAYAAANVAHVRQMTGRPGVPVHMIGGLADRLGRAEAAAFVDGARAAGAAGVSFYDVALSGPEVWAALARFSRRR